jgi:LPS export ABC transporter protein LptC
VSVSVRRLVLILTAVWCGACSRTPPAPAASAAGAGPVYQISAQGTKHRPVTISNINHGQREYTLLAQNVMYATNLQQGTFHNNQLYFFKGGKPRLTVTAPVAVVDEHSHNIYLSGGVVARTTAGDTLASDSMTYDEKTRLLTAVGHVVATDPQGYKLSGTRAVADLDLQQIRLFSQGPTEAPTP